MSLLQSNQFIMQKKILSVREQYEFFNLKGSKLAHAEGNILQIPPKFIVQDIHGFEVMHLEGKTVSIRNEFAFYTPNGQELATIKRKITKLVGEEFWLEQNGVEFMRIYGDFTEHDYQMVTGNMQVAAVHKKWVTLRDQMSVEITGQIDHRIVIGAVIVIEHAEAAQQQSSSNRDTFSINGLSSSR